MKSISFYIVTSLIKLKGIKSSFSKAPIDYLRLRKNDIKTPNKKLLIDQDSNTFKISKSRLTEIIPARIKKEDSIILYCPGGAFVYGPTDINWKFCAKIAKETQLRTFLIDYPKAPEAQIDEINANIDAVYNYFVEQKSIKNIVLIGDSVGGTLLMSLIQRVLKSQSKIKSKGIILISPVADCSMTNPKIEDVDENDIMLSLNGVLSAKQMCAGKIDLKSEIISPIYGNFKNFIETYIFIAENDIMQPDQELLVKKLITDHVFIKVFRGYKNHHIWPLLPYMKEAKESIKEIISIIKTLDYNIKDEKIRK